MSKPICGQKLPVFTSHGNVLDLILIMKKPGPKGGRVQIGYTARSAKTGWTVQEQGSECLPLQIWGYELVFPFLKRFYWNYYCSRGRTSTVEVRNKQLEIKQRSRTNEWLRCGPPPRNIIQAKRCPIWTAQGEWPGNPEQPLGQWRNRYLTNSHS